MTAPAATAATAEQEPVLETVTVMVASDQHDPASKTGAPLKFPKEARLLPPEMQHGYSVSHPSSDSGGPYGLHLFVDEEVLAETPVGTLIAFPDRYGEPSGEVFEVTAHHDEHRHRPVGKEEELCDSCIVVKPARVIADVESGEFDRQARVAEMNRREVRNAEQRAWIGQRRDRLAATLREVAELDEDDRAEVLAELSDDQRAALQGGPGAGAPAFRKQVRLLIESYSQMIEGVLISRSKDEVFAARSEEEYARLTDELKVAIGLDTEQELELARLTAAKATLETDRDQLLQMT